MVSQRMKQLGTARSVIRELFEYGNQRAAQVGRENVFDFSIGNPSVPPPPQVNETAIRLLQTEDPTALHGYTSAQGDAAARALLAADLNKRFQAGVSADDLYITVGAAAALCCVFHGLACPRDEFLVIAPYFPEYQVFIEGTGCSMKVVQPDPSTLQIDPVALEAAITEHTKAVVVNSPTTPPAWCTPRIPSGQRRTCWSARAGHTATPSTWWRTSPTERSCSTGIPCLGCPRCIRTASCAIPSPSPCPCRGSASAMCWFLPRCVTTTRGGAEPGLCQRPQPVPAGGGGVLRAYLRPVGVRPQRQTAGVLPAGDGLHLRGATGGLLSVPQDLRTGRRGVQPAGQGV